MNPDHAIPKRSETPSDKQPALLDRSYRDRRYASAKPDCGEQAPNNSHRVWRLMALTHGLPMLNAGLSGADSDAARGEEAEGQHDGDATVTPGWYWQALISGLPQQAGDDPTRYGELSPEGAMGQRSWNVGPPVAPGPGARSRCRVRLRLAFAAARPWGVARLFLSRKRPWRMPGGQGRRSSAARGGGLLGPGGQRGSWRPLVRPAGAQEGDGEKAGTLRIISESHGARRCSCKVG
jgi:hypothetical protein